MALYSPVLYIILVPGLLSSIPVITPEYTTNRTIGIMVDVNEGINCLDKDQLYINTSISDSSGVISSSRDFFSDGLILHGILSPGAYTCSVSVMKHWNLWTSPVKQVVIVYVIHRIVT